VAYDYVEHEGNGYSSSRSKSQNNQFCWVVEFTSAWAQARSAKSPVPEKSITNIGIERLSKKLKRVESPAPPQGEAFGSL